MNIFFSASIHGKSDFAQNYQTIIKKVNEQGHTIKGDHIIEVDSEKMASWTPEEDIAFHKKMMDGIKHADALFVEVSYGSTSSGYLIALALNAGKPVVAFYSGTEEPHLFKTLEATNEKFEVIRYTDVSDLEKEVPFALDFVSDAQDTRFNFFISAELSSYLNWVSKYKKIPRSVYLRGLIEGEMAKQNRSAE